MNTEEMTIDIMDLLRRCLLRWKFIVVWMLIGAIALDGVGCLKSIKDAKAVEAQLAVDEEENESEKQEMLSEYMQKLTEREVSEVQNAVLSYTAYQQEYADGLKYYQESMKMKLDPSCVPTMRLQYIVDNHYEVTYPVIAKKDTTQDIISILAEKVRSEEVSNAVADALNHEVSAAYVQELLTTSADDSNQTSNSGNDAFIINMVAENREDCQKIAEIVKSTIDQCLDSVRAVCGDFDIKLASEQFYETSDRDLMSAQQSATTSLNSLRSAINNLPYMMTDDQKTYYYALLDNEKMIDTGSEDETITEDDSELDVPVLTVPEVKYISLKYILVGLVAGAVCACGWIALRYLLSGKLRTADDLPEGFEINTLGNVTLEKVKFPGFMKKSYYTMTKEEQLSVIISEIQVTAEKENIHRLFITSSVMNDALKEIGKAISSGLDNEHLVCSVGETALYDPEEIRSLSNADGVIFVEQIGVSKFEEIAKEKAVAGRAHTQILGCVVVE